MANTKFSDNIFKLMADASPNALILVDDNKIIRYVNLYAERLFQYTAAELSGESVDLLIPRRYRAQHEIYADAYLQNPSSRPMGAGRDLYVLRRDGSEFPAEIALNPLVHNSEKKILVMISDITERKKAEELLKNQKLRLAGIIEGTNAGAWEWNFVQNEIIINNKWAEIIGCSKNELTPLSGESFLRIIHEKDRKKAEKLIDQLFKNKTDVYEIEYRVKHKNEKFVWVFDRGKIISRGARHEPVLMMGTRQDITDRKLAQIEFKSILATTLDGFFATDEKGHIIEVNEAFCNMLGYRRDELLTMGVPDIEAKESTNDVKKHLQKIFRKGYDRFETVHKRKDNTSLDVEISVTLIDIGMKKLIVFARDISKRKHAEKIVKKSEENLKQAQKIGKIGHWEYNIAKDELYWSEQTYNIYEVSPDAFKVNFQNVVNLFHPEDRQYVIDAFFKSVNSDRRLEVTHRIITPSGKMKHITQRAENHYDKSGNPVISLGSVQDITETKEYEDEILLRNEKLAALSDELQTANNELKRKNKAINESISYAKKIQYSILPDLDEICSYFSEFYYYYKPKDVIGGDFYWFYKSRKNIFLAVADSTGHSVPGAMMSMVVNSLLNEIIIRKSQSRPAVILADLHHELYHYLNQDKGDRYSQDGCDISLCKIELENSRLQFAGARHDLFICGKSKLEIIRGTPKSIGGIALTGEHEPERSFDNHNLPLSENVFLAMTTDGITDQLDQNNQIFGKKSLKKMLRDLYRIPPEERQKFINETINRRKKNTRQLDDMLLTVFKIRNK